MGRYPEGRQPYGRRRGSHGWVEDALPHYPEDWRDLPYNRGDRVRAVKMPRGGVRYLYACRMCGSWRTMLYNLHGTPGILVCRVCMQLRYRSQYIGRRVDASAERLSDARRELEQVKPPRRTDTHERRALRLIRATATYEARQYELRRRQTLYLIDHERRLSRRWRRSLSRQSRAA